MPLHRQCRFLGLITNLSLSSVPLPPRTDLVCFRGQPPVFMKRLSLVRRLMMLLFLQFLCLCLLLNSSNTCCLHLMLYNLNSLWMLMNLNFVADRNRRDLDQCFPLCDMF